MLITVLTALVIYHDLMKQWGGFAEKPAEDPVK